MLARAGGYALQYAEADIVRFMRQAISLARDAMRDGRGGPFGAVVVKSGRLVSSGGNCVVRGRDPTAHAEVVAIRQACASLGTHSLAGCVMFSSCEPCPMCLGAVYWARIERLWYAAPREDAARAGFDDALILGELVKPLDQRSMSMTQRLRREAVSVLDEWSVHPDKVRY
jgi:guanine deaminase